MFILSDFVEDLLSDLLLNTISNKDVIPKENAKSAIGNAANVFS